MTKDTDLIGSLQDQAFIRQMMENSFYNNLLEELVKKNPEDSNSILYAFTVIQLNFLNRSKMSQGNFKMFQLPSLPNVMLV